MPRHVLSAIFRDEEKESIAADLNFMNSVISGYTSNPVHTAIPAGTAYEVDYEVEIAPGKEIDHKELGPFRPSKAEINQALAYIDDVKQQASSDQRTTVRPGPRSPRSLRTNEL
ncbi:uncharacterized protein EHS24_003144 [Apiotrichum porosum]|uniref:Uncharacterized protein n=1 Tax=Apiotrichum porosum TaxID=105984 RepID=A0A427XFU0_9TREE|nr:uncharacterized protein EHS24_003144 [Apiotrichum porosum]RSH77584.1 hypothetical protein EHS24_003144 [Apiotrichum porosum]